MNRTKKERMKIPYAFTIRWSPEDEAYIARVPALEGCIAHGDTFHEAADNIVEAMEAFLESMKEHGDPIPHSELVSTELRRFAPIINTSALARRAGLNKNTLASKLRRGTRFTDQEADAIQKALEV